MNRDPWLVELENLLVRYPALGVGADVGTMGLCELWGLYCLLRRMAEVSP